MTERSFTVGVCFERPVFILNHGESIDRAIFCGGQLINPLFVRSRIVYGKAIKKCAREIGIEISEVIAMHDDDIGSLLRPRAPSDGVHSFRSP